MHGRMDKKVPVESSCSRARGISLYEVRTRHISPTRQTRCALVAGARSVQDAYSIVQENCVHCDGLSVTRCFRRDLLVVGQDMSSPKEAGT